MPSTAGSAAASDPAPPVRGVGSDRVPSGVGSDRVPTARSLASEPARHFDAVRRFGALERASAVDLLAAQAVALDDAAVDPRPRLRWYVPTDAALVLGRGQRAPAHAPDLPVLQRATGGGAVLLDDRILSCDVVLPAGHPWLDGDLGHVFLLVGTAWKAALADLGVRDLSVVRTSTTPSRRGTERDRLLASICYATLGRGEVTAAGRKLVGLAQRRRRHGALVACGLLRRWRPAPLLAAFAGEPDDPEVAAAAVGLDELLHPPPSDDAVVEAVTSNLVNVADF